MRALCRKISNQRWVRHSLCYPSTALMMWQLSKQDLGRGDITTMENTLTISCSPTPSTRCVPWGHGLYTLPVREVSFTAVPLKLLGTAHSAQRWCRAWWSGGHCKYGGLGYTIKLLQSFGAGEPGNLREPPRGEWRQAAAGFGSWLGLFNRVSYQLSCLCSKQKEDNSWRLGTTQDPVTSSQSTQLSAPMSWEKRHWKLASAIIYWGPILCYPWSPPKN
jgi:hypothetical protein